MVVASVHQDTLELTVLKVWITPKPICTDLYSPDQIASEVLISGVTMHGQISRANEWRYFHFTANQTSLVIALQEENIQNGQAFLGIYLAENAIPTFRYVLILLPDP